MKKALTLSIVIPVYNEEGQIENCLQSIAGQTVRAFEVIVVDNNSSDKTVDLVEQYPFVRLLHEKRQGIVFARNAGFDDAKGDIIGRIDADTVLPPIWVETILNEAERSANKDAFTGPCYFRSSFGKSGLFWLHRVVYFFVTKALLGHYPLFGSNMFFFRESWIAVRDQTCRRTDVHEDMDLAVHITEQGGKIIFLPNLLASISLRTWLHSRRYVQMWIMTKLVHR